MPTAPFTIAAVQATPVVLDRDATIEKACRLIAEAAGHGARLVLFPESFVPAYPDWAWAVPPGNRNVHGPLYARLLENAVEVPSPATARLGEAAREANVYVAMGVTERNTEASGASLYNTLVYFGTDGSVLGKHRKLVPTAAERLIWAPGGGDTLGVYETELGTIGGLICWENYMPLARYAMFAWGTQVYLAPTWDRSDAWFATLRHIAKEGRVYVAGCCMALRHADLPDEVAAVYGEGGGEWINIGNSAIVSPKGEVIAGPLAEQEGILYAEVDPALVEQEKWMLDVAGHYARPDVFDLRVRRSPTPMVNSEE